MSKRYVNSSLQPLYREKDDKEIVEIDTHSYRVLS